MLPLPKQFRTSDLAAKSNILFSLAETPVCLVFAVVLHCGPRLASQYNNLTTIPDHLTCPHNYLGKVPMVQKHLHTTI